MNYLVDQYLYQCMTVGILTVDKFRNYPLRAGNLGVVLKLYSLYAKLPFVFDITNIEDYEDKNMYLTTLGYNWLINEFKKYTLVYLRSTFRHVFSNLKNIEELETYKGLNNFKGIVGENYKAGTLSGAVLIREHGVKKYEWSFQTLAEARKEVINLTRFYPIEQFTLYRTGESKSVYYKQKVPLILESNRRGVPVNLPHLKGKL